MKSILMKRETLYNFVLNLFINKKKTALLLYQRNIKWSIKLINDTKKLISLKKMDYTVFPTSFIKISFFKN